MQRNSNPKGRNADRRIFLIIVILIFEVKNYSAGNYIGRLEIILLNAHMTDLREEATGKEMKRSAFIAAYSNEYSAKRHPDTVNDPFDISV